MARRGPAAPAGRSGVPSHQAVYARRRRAMARDARHGVVPGVLLEVHGLGVLVEGPSGIGKSRLALDLVLRGHRLVADDAVEVSAPADGVLVGRSPEMLRGLIEVRGLGVLNLRKLHGARALRDSVRIDLVITLERRRGRRGQRLLAGRSFRRILGVRVDRLRLPASLRRLRDNLPSLVETACLEQELRLLGLSSGDELERRQRRAMRSKK